MELARSLRYCFGLVLVLAGLIVFAPSAPAPALTADDPPTIAAAGNIACDPTYPHFNGGDGSPFACRQKYTSDLLLKYDYDAVLSLGDNQYQCGGASAYQQAYDPSWGRVKDKIFAVAGDKEYRTSANSTGTGCEEPPGEADGFFGYFGAVPRPGYYSFDIGTWHLIALSGNCDKGGGCTPGTPQYEWLMRDLQTHSNACTLAFWHAPRFSSGVHGSRAEYTAFWELLYAEGADVVLNAHEHNYERFMPQDSAGVGDRLYGIRQFTVGTGGVSHARFPSTPPLPTSQVRNDTTFGILRLSLRYSGYAWEFVPEDGQTWTDSGGRACHGKPEPPPQPQPTSQPTA